MATKKKVVKMRDLKPAKDAKGGVSLNRGSPAAGQQSSAAEQPHPRTAITRVVPNTPPPVQTRAAVPFCQVRMATGPLGPVVRFSGC